MITIESMIKLSLRIALEPSRPWSICALLRFLHQYLNDVNFFPSAESATNSHVLRTERLSTKTFVITFVSLVAILLVYISTITTTYTIVIKTPTLNQYHHLLTLNARTLICPCSEVSIGYSQFINVTYTLHPICSSVYISEEWRRYLVGDAPSLKAADFRILGIHLFLGLESMCRLAEDTIHLNLNQFKSNSYITSVVIDETNLQSQVDAIVQQFIATTSNSFANSLRMIRDTTHSNAHLTALMTNFHLFARPYSPHINSEEVSYDDRCYCSYDSTCTSQIAIYDSNGMVIWKVPGILNGCYLLEALRQSNLACFYNRTCLNELDYYLNSSLSFSHQPLESTKLSRFLPSTTIGTAIDQLMVDRWTWTAHHAHYYRTCQPTECTYQLIARNSLIEIVTILIGLIGGLITALKILIPRIVRISIALIQWRRRTTIHSTGNSHQLEVQTVDE